MVALVVVVVLHASHGLPFNWDDQGQYLSHARALIEGRPYTDIGFIYTNHNNFIGPVAEPPGLPLIIAPALAVSGSDLIPVRAVLLGFLIATLWLIWKFARTLTDSWTSTAAIVFVIAVFSEQHVLDGVMADLPFIAAIWCVILAADSPDGMTRGRLVNMAIAGAAAFAFRMAALALIPALVLMIILRPRREWPGLSLVGIVWLTAAALVMFAMPTSSALVAETSRDAGQFLRDAVSNAGSISQGILESFLYPFPWNLANDVYHLFAVPLTAFGAYRLIRSSPRRFVFLFAIAYVGMLVVLPTRASRYWWPLTPLQALALMEGVNALLRREGRVPRIATASLAGFLLAVGSLRSRREPAAPLHERPDFIQLVDRIRLHVGSTEPRVAFFSPRLFSWHTRIPAMGHFRASPDGTLAELRDKRISFLVYGSLGEYPQYDASFDRALEANPRSFQRVADIGSFTLYRVLTESPR